LSFDISVNERKWSACSYLRATAESMRFRLDEQTQMPHDGAPRSTSAYFNSDEIEKFNKELIYTKLMKILEDTL